MAWKTRKPEYPKGICTIKLLKNGNLGVQFIEDEDDFAGERYQIRTFPDNLVKESLPGRQWRVRLGGERKDQLFSISPLTGVFKVKVQKLASQEDSPPVPRFNEFTWKGEDASYYTFTPILEVVEGDCKGMTLTYNLRYYFFEDEDGNVGIDKPRSKYTPPLTEFLQLSGVIGMGSMEYSENILPDMQKRIMKAGTQFKAIVKNGYVDSIMESEEFTPSGGEEEEWDDEEDWDNLDPSETSPKPSSEESVDVDDWD